MLALFRYCARGGEKEHASHTAVPHVAALSLYVPMQALACNICPEWLQWHMGGAGYMAH